MSGLPSSEATSFGRGRCYVETPQNKSILLVFLIVFLIVRFRIRLPSLLFGFAIR